MLVQILDRSCVNIINCLFSLILPHMTLPIMPRNNFKFLSQFCFYLISLQYSFFTLAQSTAYEERTIAYFNGSSFLMLRSVFDFNQSRIGFSFKTCQENGNLLHQVFNNGDQFQIKIQNGTLVTEAYINSENKTTSVSIGSQLNDNRWINVDFFQTNTKTGPHVIASVAYGNVVLVNRSIILDFKFTNTSDLYMGNTQDESHGFIGCIFNGPNLPFHNSADEKHISWDQCPLDNKLGCETNFCYSQPCLNGGSCSNGHSSYICMCPARYNGSNCEIDMGSLCSNFTQSCGNGTCVEVEGGNRAMCECASGYHGSKCGSSGANPCDNSTCLNNSTCESHDSFNHTCWCNPGFSGDVCGINDNECESQPCQNNGRCNDLINAYECLCDGTGYKGSSCSIDVDECLNNPCAQNATCFNRPGDFLCVCPSGFQGRYCNISIDYCLSEPCQNGGACTNQSDGYTCECTTGFTGVHCESEIDNCVGNLCDPYSQECVNQPKTYYCVCKRGFGGPDCTNLDECADQPCVNNATCVDGIDKFSCLCLPGYTGILCETDINECENNPCMNEASCNDLLNDYSCACQLGWTGKNCSQEFQPCQSSPCHNNASCTTLLHTVNPGYNCTCLPGFSGYHCEVNTDDCADIECGYNEQCLDGIENYMCNCNAGYMRDVHNNCTIDIDECSSNPCNNNGTCHDLLNAFTCNCTFGYEGTTCENEVNFCDLNLCQNEAVCHSTFGSYKCYCGSGYVGVHCEFLYDSCLSNPCIHGNCLTRAEDGLYECNCSLGYDGINCGNDINECISNPCMNEGECNDLIGQFNCTCKDGWAGPLCEENIDECQSDPCQNDGNCTDEIAGYECSCQPGYAGLHCEIDINECESSPCQNGGSCINEIAMYTCICNGTGYTGLVCDEEINECSLYEPCYNGATCRDLINNYECQCPSGYAGQDCENDIKECNSNPCANNGTCLEKSDQSLYPHYFPGNFSYNDAEGFVCLCSAGYEGEFCGVEINECVTWNPCQNHVACNNLVNDYTCVCTSGYGGRNCSVALVGCDGGHNCLNNATCLPYLQDEENDVHNYTCECQPGFSGYFCQKSTTSSFADGSTATFLPPSAIPTQLVSFAFRTTLSSGLLATLTFSNINDTIKVYLQDGFVHTEQNNFVGKGSSLMNDGEWHAVKLELSNTVPMRLPDKATNTENISAVSTNNIGGFVLSHIIVGWDNDSMVPSYTGCIRDIKVDSHVFAVQDAYQIYNVSQGCSRSQVCLATSCGGKGTCVDLWTKSRCDCYRPYIGENCTAQVKPATFGYGSTASYAMFNLTKIPYNEFDFSIFILTLESSGILLYTGLLDDNTTSSQVTMQLSNGNFQVVVDSNAETTYTHDATVNDGEYHFIEAKIEKLKLTINLDHSSDEYTLPYMINITTREMYIGGVPQTQGTRKRRATTPGHFKGALQDIQLNGDTFVMFDNDAPNDIAPSRTINFPTEVKGVRSGVVSDPVCDSNPCQNGGMCNVTFNDYTCNCTDGWKGKNCDFPKLCQQITCPSGLTCSDLSDGGFECLGASTFDTSQFVDYTWNGNNTLMERLYFSVRTRSVNTSILSIQSMTGSIQLELDLSGRIAFKYDSIDQSDKFTSNLAINDGLWHNVTVSTGINSFATLNVDDVVASGNVTYSLSAISEILSQANNSVRIGGSETSSFKGCIENVRIGDELLPFYNQSEVSKNATALNSTHFALTTSSPSLTLGCHSDDVCGASNPCENDGTCSDLFNEFQCSCKAGFTGGNCSINIDDCAGVSCSNNGTCTDGIDGFKCKCIAGYEGELCKLEINECKPSPCFNNATCHNMIGSFRCDCNNTDLAGDLCQFNVTQACGDVNDTHAPCTHGGTCVNKTVDNKVTFECKCSFPYIGVTCEREIDLCENLTCMNNGTCLPDQTTMTSQCECAPGFGGMTCQNVIEQCKNDTCRNNATCNDTDDGFKCNCTKDFIGRRCEHFNRCHGDTFCFNGGNCSVTFDPDENPIFYCRCLTSHAGNQCEYDNPCMNSTCNNGGTCLVVMPSDIPEPVASGEDPTDVMVPLATCECAPGFSGSNCDEVSQQRRPYNPWIIVGPIIGGVALVIITITLVAFLCYARGARAERGTYSPQATESMGVTKTSTMPPKSLPERLI